MSSPVNLCGAKKRDGGTCRQRVSKPGERCPNNKDKPLSPKSIMKLCYGTIRVVSELGGFVAAFQMAYPHITELWHPVRGLLMPEHFWDYGFEPKDVPRMLEEEKKALERSEELEKKYSDKYSDHEKLRIERVYLEILAYVGSVKVGA